MRTVTIPLDWSNMESHVMYRVYLGMRLWLEERGVEHTFGFNINGSSYYPSSVSMDEISAVSFRLIF